MENNKIINLIKLTTCSLSLVVISPLVMMNVTKQKQFDKLDVSTNSLFFNGKTYIERFNYDQKTLYCSESMDNFWLGSQIEFICEEEISRTFFGTKNKFINNQNISFLINILKTEPNSEYDYGRLPTTTQHALHTVVYNEANWQSCINNSLWIALNNKDTKWGPTIFDFWMDYELLWKRYASAKNILAPVLSTDDNMNPYVYYDVSSFPFYAKNGEGVNTYNDLYGPNLMLNVSFKELDKTLYDAFRCIYPKNGLAVEDNKKKLAHPEIVDTYPVAYTYSIADLISITQSNHKNRTFQLGFDYDFINKAKILYDHRDATKQRIESKLLRTVSSAYIDCPLTFVDMGLLGEDNVDDYINFLPIVNMYIDYYKSYTWLKQHPSKAETDYAQSLGFNKYDNPYWVIDYILPKLSYVVEYSIRDVNKPDQWVQKVVNVDYEQMKNGFNININSNQYNQLDFKINRVYTNSVKDSWLYIDSDETETVKNLDSDISLSDGVYKFKDDVVVSASFKDNNESFNGNFFVREISDEAMINTYVNLLTNYNEAGDFSLLSSDQYYLERNEIKCSITINLLINDLHYSKTFTGFKYKEIQLIDLDGSLDSYNLIPQEVDQREIRKLMVLNGVDEYLANALGFQVINIDNFNGSVEVKVIYCDEESLRSSYVNQTFSINNLQPYYIKQNNNISSDILKMKPSEITNDIFTNYFLVMSNEFKNRNGDSLIISLKSDDKNGVLTSSITYYDEVNKQDIKLSYEFDNLAKTNDNNIIDIIDIIDFTNDPKVNWIKILIWAGIGGIGITSIGVIFYIVIRRVRRRKVEKNVDKDSKSMNE